MTTPAPQAALPLWQKALTEWAAWVAVVVFVGALALRFLVTTPASRRMPDAERSSAVRAVADRRLLRVSAVALLLFLPATVSQLAYQAGDGRFAYGKMGTALIADFAGQLWLARLAGSARNQALQAQAANLSQTAQAGPARVTLTPSGRQPGLTDYDVTVTGAGAARVTLTFAAARLGVPSQEVVATATGGGHFRATGYYTPMAGDWRVLVTTDGSPQQAAFTLPVTAKAAKPPKAPARVVQTSTWVAGIAEVIAVVFALWSGRLMSRYLTARRIRRARGVPAAGPAHVAGRPGVAAPRVP